MPRTPVTIPADIDLFAPRGRWGATLPAADFIEVGDCWEWTGNHVNNGYGITTYQGRTYLAHRLVWEALVGPIPDSLEVDHLCLNRGCCNPDHLELVTHAENMRRSQASVAAQNRRKTHCARGHPFSGDNLYINPGTGQRHCRICTNESVKRFQARQ